MLFTIRPLPAKYILSIVEADDPMDVVNEVESTMNQAGFKTVRAPRRQISGEFHLEMQNASTGETVTMEIDSVRKVAPSQGKTQTQP